MEHSRFDAVAKLLATRRSRRAALAQGGAGLAVAGLAAAGLASHAAAQEATPEATPGADEVYDPSRKVPYLFVQSFESGTVAAKDGEDGTYTVTLDHGLGQTLYFSDRPARDVGAVPTAQFLGDLGFPAANPPNAALVVETSGGETDIAVVELFAPTYDEASRTATYDVKVLANWADSTELGFAEAPADLAAVAPSFGAAHLFIDDCANANLSCCAEFGTDPFTGGEGACIKVAKDYGTVGYCAQYGRCVPCVPFYHDAPSYEATWDYWQTKCTIDAPAACPDNACEPGWWVS